jgi:hypothetical protein
MLLMKVLDIGRMGNKCRENFDKKFTCICNGYLKDGVAEGVISICLY